MTTKYWIDRYDSGNVYAIKDDSNGIFQLFRDDIETGPWVFLEPESESWDWVHQLIFRQMKCTELQPEEIDDMNLPVLPESPSGPFPTHAERLGKGKEVSVWTFPNIANWVGDECEASVWVVLHEDIYETAFGDGKFIDFVNAFPTIVDAESLIESRKPGDYERYTIVSFTLRIKDSFILSDDFSPGTFEHYKFEQCLLAVERRLATNE